MSWGQLSTHLFLRSRGAEQGGKVCVWGGVKVMGKKGTLCRAEKSPNKNYYSLGNLDTYEVNWTQWATSKQKYVMLTENNYTIWHQHMQLNVCEPL